MTRVVIFTDREKAIAREIIALSNLEGTHPADWAARAVALVRQSPECRPIVDAIVPLVPLADRIIAQLTGGPRADDTARHRAQLTR